MEIRFYGCLNLYIIAWLVNFLLRIMIFQLSDWFPKPMQGVKLTFFPGSHLAPKYFKVVANSKKLVAMTNAHNHFYLITVLDRLNCWKNSHELQIGH